jgi:hydroxyacylglutathione hydrolase
MFDFTKNRLHYIKGGRYPHCHTLFIDDKVRTLIDPACEETVLRQLQENGPIDVIINSHCHEDHFFNNYLFPEASFWAHALEAPFFRNLEVLLDAWLSPEQKAGPLGEETRNFLVNETHYREREPNRLLQDGEEVSLGDTIMQVIHTPGHSPGHLCFYFPDEKVLYTADLDLVKAGPYYGDKGSSIEETIRSLERIMKIDAAFYLSAHGKQGIYPGDPDTVRQYLDVIYVRENRLLEALKDGPKSLDEIAALGIIYGKRDSSDIWFIAASERNMMEKHLERLVEAGTVFPDGNRYVLD